MKDFLRIGGFPRLPFSSGSCIEFRERMQPLPRPASGVDPLPTVAALLGASGTFLRAARRSWIRGALLNCPATERESRPDLPTRNRNADEFVLEALLLRIR